MSTETPDQAVERFELERAAGMVPEVNAIVQAGQQIRLAIAGLAGSGKTTVSNYLRDEYGFHQASLASPLKIIATHARWLVQNNVHQYDGLVRLIKSLPWDDESDNPNFHKHPFMPKKHWEDAYWGCVKLLETCYAELLGNGKPRTFLQQLGTDVCRKIQPDVWVRYLLKYADPLNNLVCDDVRFINEATILRDAGWTVVRVQCKPEERLRRLHELYGNTTLIEHASEREIDQVPVSTVFLTDEETWWRDPLDAWLKLRGVERQPKKSLAGQRPGRTSYYLGLPEGE